MKVLGLCALTVALMMVSCGPKEPQPNNENKDWESLEIKMAELPQLCQSLIKQDTAKIGSVAAEKLIHLIENPRTTLIQRFVMNGELIAGESVADIN